MSAQNYITALTDQQQIAALRQELAAKDREIAELRAALADYKTRVEKLAESLADRYGERDKARECVGRLHSALRLAMSRSIHHSECDRLKSSFDEYDHSPQKECSCHISTMGAALAATPEHLRNA